jgi:predicted RNase H-like nuclease
MTCVSPTLVARPVDVPGAATVQLAATFEDVLNLCCSFAVIAVDIPIGLPPRSGVGGRIADIKARSRLGDRQSSVFSVPARAAVMQADYRTACAVATAHSDPPRKVSKQAFNLFPKIREVDALMTPERQARVVECHPELAFWALNAERPLCEPKKVKSRPHEPGLVLRRGLLATAGYDARLLCDVAQLKPVRGGPDDLLDAAACSWTAAMIVLGRAHRFPADPQVDGRGLRMEIWG